MSTQKVTPWFKAQEHLPTRAGYYQTKCTYSFWSVMVYWDGRAWQIDHEEKTGCSFGQGCDSWRGLLKARQA